MNNFAFRAIVFPLILSIGIMPAQAEVDAYAVLQELPGFQFELQRADVVVTHDSGVYTLEMNSLDATVHLFQTRTNASQPWHGILKDRNPGRFDFDELAPDLGKKIFGTVSIQEVVLVVSSGDEKIALKKLPSQLRSVLAPYGDNFDFYEGASIMVSLSPGTTGLLGKVTNNLEISEPVRVAGQVDKNTAMRMLQVDGYEEANGRVKLSVTLPGITPPPFNRIGDESTLDLAFPKTEISIEREEGDAGNDYQVSVDQDVSVWILDHQIDTHRSLAINKTGNDEYTVEQSADIKLDWQPRQLSGVVLNSIGFTIAVDSGNQTEIDFSLGLKATLAEHGPLSGSLHLSGQRSIEKLVLSLEGIDTGNGLELGAMPLFKQFPLSSRVAFKQLEIGLLLEKKDLYLKGETFFKQRQISVDAVLLRKNHKGKHPILLAAKTDGMNLRSLLPALPPVTEQLSLDHGVLTFSVGDFKGVREVPDVITELFAGTDVEIDSIPSGTGLVLPLDPGTISADVGNALKSLGIEQPLVLSGSVGGVFQGDPSLSLSVSLPSLPTPKLGGQRLNVKELGGGAFLSIGPGSGGPELQLGFDGSMITEFADDELEFGGKVFLELSSSSQGVQVAGRMMGEWDDPLGLTGIAFRDVVLGGGVNADSSIELNFQGEADFGERLRYGMAGDVAAIMGSGVPVPKKLGLMFHGSELSMTTQLKLMGALVKAAASGPLADAIPAGPTQTLLRQVSNVNLLSTVEDTLPLPYVIYKDPAFYLATPGASVKGFDDIEGLGGAVRGSLEFMNHNFGSVDSYMTLQNGVKIYAEAGAFDLGILKLDEAILDILVPMPLLSATTEKPHANLRGQASAGCSALSGQIDVGFTRQEASFHTAANLFGYQAALDASVDLSKFPKFKAKSAFEDSLIKDLMVALREAATARIAERKKTAEANLAAAKKKVKSASDKVSKEVAKRREIRRKEVDNLRLSIIATMRTKKSNSIPPVTAIWNNAIKYTGRMRVGSDGTLTGTGKAQTYLSNVKTAANNLYGNAKTNAVNAINAVQGKFNSLKSQASGLKAHVEKTSQVKAVRKALASAQAKSNAAKQALADVIDPLSQSILDSAGVLQIDKVGFDAGLDAVCKERLPKLTVSGVYKGEPFKFKGLVQLTEKEQLATKNEAAMGGMIDEMIRQYPEEKPKNVKPVTPVIKPPVIPIKPPVNVPKVPVNIPKIRFRPG